MSKPKIFASWTPEKQEEWMEKRRAQERKYDEANREKNAERVKRARG